MNFKTFWTNRNFKSWLCSFIPVFVLLLAIVLTLTCNTFLYETVNVVLGGERRVLQSGDASKYQYYTGDYKNKKDVLAAANDFNERVAEEGIVLLLPRAKPLRQATTKPLSIPGAITTTRLLW